MNRSGATPDPWLVLYEPGDGVAPWLAERLEASGAGAILATGLELCTAAAFRHTVGTDGAGTWHVRLPDGREIDGERLRGVVNRLAAIPAEYLASAEPADRGYVDGEWRALLCSVLASVARRGVPVLPLPTPYSPAGPFRSTGEWLLAAARAGFATPPWRWPPVPAQTPAATRSGAALVVGGRVLAPIGDRPLPRAAADACLRLSEAVGEPLLGISAGFDAGDDGPPDFAGATTLPDLRAFGDAAIEALDLLARAGATASR